MSMMGPPVSTRPSSCSCEQSGAVDVSDFVCLKCSFCFLLTGSFYPFLQNHQQLVCLDVEQVTTQEGLELLHLFDLTFFVFLFSDTSTSNMFFLNIFFLS